MGIIRDSIVVYRDWADGINELPEEYQLECYKALFAYGLDDELPDNLSPITKSMLRFIRTQMESNKARYQASVENGKKGGRPKTQDNQSITQENPTITQNNLDITQENLDEPKPNLNVHVYDNVHDIIKEESEKEESETSPLSTRSAKKKKYGKYKNVLLTEQEYEALLSEPDGKEAIEFFSEYREIKGYKSKNDNLAIRKWAFLAVKEARQRQSRAEKPNSKAMTNYSKREYSKEELNSIITAIDAVEF